MRRRESQHPTMMTLNCTRKLAKRLPLPMVENPQPSTNRLGPWCANSFNVGRFPLIILTNERTLLSVVIPFKDIRSVHIRFLTSLEVLFHSIALSSSQIRDELQEMKVVQFMENTNRRTLGSMNDFVFHVRAALDDNRNDTLEDIAFHLSGIPCAPLKYGFPRDAVLDVIDPPPHHRQSEGRA